MAVKDHIFELKLLLVLILVDECSLELTPVCVGETDDGGEILLDLGVFAAYFMGEPGFADSVIEPSLYIVHSADDNLSSEFSGTPEEIEELYGLKIIEYHYDAPVENSFGK